MAAWTLRLLGVGNASAVELGSAMATIELHEKTPKRLSSGSVISKFSIMIGAESVIM